MLSSSPFHCRFSSHLKGSSKQVFIACWSSFDIKNRVLKHCFFQFSIFEMYVTTSMMRNLAFENRLHRRTRRLSLGAWLHGEFQPGLKYCWDYMLNFSPGAKRKFTEVRKHSQCACSRSFFDPGWNSVSITWDFFGFSARAELCSGLNTG